MKPIIRKVWAKVGQRPLALVDPRYEWTYLYGFVHPTTGDTEWLILPRVNGDWFNQALATFAEQVGAGPHKQIKQILLVIDGAGWHTCKDLVIPDGIHLEVLPPYSPELQPAERLWRLADEPLVNRCFDALRDLEVLKRQSGKCPACGLYFRAEDRMEVDHVLPPGATMPFDQSSSQLLELQLSFHFLQSHTATQKHLFF